MIGYVEVRNQHREVTDIIDDYQSIIWQSLFQGVGEFEIYAPKSTLKKINLGYYITRPNNEEVGIIENIEIKNEETGGQMVVISGRFIKSILDRRIVYTSTLKGEGLKYWWSCEPTFLSGKVEEEIRKLIYKNAVNCDDDKRNITEIYWTDEDISGIAETIKTPLTGEEADKQVTYKNLLDYTESILTEYNLGAKMWLDLDTLKFRYKIYTGEDKTIESDDPIIFSKEYDNLTTVNYSINDTNKKNFVLVGGEGEGTERICAKVGDWESGLNRREIFLDASSLAQETQDIETYRKTLETQGQQTMAQYKTIQTYNGVIDLSNSNLKYGVDFKMGDFITLEDESFDDSINAQIVGALEVEDDNGYSIEIEYAI